MSKRTVELDGQTTIYNQSLLLCGARGSIEWSCLCAGRVAFRNFVATLLRAVIAPLLFMLLTFVVTKVGTQRRSPSGRARC